MDNGWKKAGLIGIGTVLGALLTLAPFPLYGRGSIEDQQLAGLLMWGPGGLFYLAGGAWIAQRWFALRHGPLRG